MVKWIRRGETVMDSACGHYRIWRWDNTPMPERPPYPAVDARAYVAWRLKPRPATLIGSYPDAKSAEAACEPA